MGLSRRNVLIGLGALVGGGGALVSTGAFSTVSAERSVEVSTAGDASAFLTITGDEEYVSDPAPGETLTIDLGGDSNEGFNQDAITTIQDIVTITNNAADGSDADVGVSTSAPSNTPTAGGSATVAVTDGGSNVVAEVTFYVGDDATDAIGGGSVQSLGSGDSATLDVEIDTTVDSSTASEDSLTIVADDPSQ